jgi:hypothetical protein
MKNIIFKFKTPLRRVIFEADRAVKMEIGIFVAESLYS